MSGSMSVVPDFEFQYLFANHERSIRKVFMRYPVYDALMYVSEGTTCIVLLPASASFIGM